MAFVYFSFKYSVLNDPLGVLDTWSYTDATPCSWHGVVCENTCVTGVSLPVRDLTATIPPIWVRFYTFGNLSSSEGGGAYAILICLVLVDGKAAAESCSAFKLNGGFFDWSNPRIRHSRQPRRRIIRRNPELCGKPLKNLCESSSSSTTGPNSTTFTPAIAGIPQSFPSTPSHNSSNSKSRFKTSTIIGIVVGDIAIVAVLALVFIYIMKKRRGAPSNRRPDEAKASNREYDWGSSEEEHKWLRSWACLMKRRNTGGEDEEEEGDESSQNSSSENSDTESRPPETIKLDNPVTKDVEKRGLVTVDGGEKELELETLLKASAYILGTTGSSIIYKAVLEDGTMLAVRRIGETG
ncbi:unnamed protein product [Lactuca saligna]|uniref:Leucine-rich repeat-containing N-terminal plant-type domain-containing protein n=1 Tax=Lactuca saligna TaxID=75948 RepID=A0AA35YQ78_LACSI|nr:unnamed protein product [Lactuca saligna]